MQESLTPEGFGKCTYSDGSWYIGQMRDNKPNGYGTKTIGTKRFSGRFVNGEIHGYGIEYQDATTWEYFGNFVNGMREGYGCLKLPEGHYEGFLFNNRPNGYGAQYFDNKKDNYYKGEFVHGLMNGYGMRCKEQSEKKIGTWLHDCMHGLGYWKLENGKSIYLGMKELIV